MGTDSSTLYHRSQNLWLEFCPISKNSSKNVEPRPGSKLLFLKTINYGSKPSLNSEKEYIEKFKEKMIIRVGDYVNSKWEEQEDDFKRWERQKGKSI